MNPSTRVPPSGLTSRMLWARSLLLLCLCLGGDGLTRPSPSLRMRVVDRRGLAPPRPLRPAAPPGRRGTPGNYSVRMLETQLTLAEDKASKPEPRWASEALWSLGSLSTESWVDPSVQRVVSELVEVLAKRRGEVSAIQLSKAFVGLARMDAHWSSSNFPSTSLLLLLEEGLGEMGSQGLANVMWSLGVLEAPKNAFPLNLKLTFLNTFQRVSRDLTDQGISSTLWGLSKLHTRWNELPMSLRSTICSVICRTCGRMSGAPQLVG